MAQNFKNFWRRKTKKATILGWIIQKSLKNEKQKIGMFGMDNSEISQKMKNKIQLNTGKKYYEKLKNKNLCFLYYQKTKKREKLFSFEKFFFQASVREFFKD